MPLIYHIAQRNDWEKALQQGYYEHPSLREEGFIHCSQEHQVEGVLLRYFPGKKDLLKLTIDTDKLSSRLVFDWSPSASDTFPHIYGVLNSDAVIQAAPV